MMNKTNKITYEHKQSFYDKQYNKYVELYEEAKKTAAAKGYSMLSPKIPRAQFNNAYNIYRDSGEYSNGIVKGIVRDQTLGLKRKNAAAFSRATYSLNPDKRLSLEQVQHMSHGELTALYDGELLRAYHNARAGGKNAKDAKLWVSQTWFGSE